MQCLTPSERSVRSVVICHRNVPGASLLSEHPCCLNATANAPTPHAGAHGTQSTADARPRPQPSLPWGRHNPDAHPSTSRNPFVRGNPRTRGRGPRGGTQTAPATCKSCIGSSAEATTHLSRRSRLERPPVTRSRPGSSHPQLRRLHGLKLPALKSLHQCLLQCRTMMTQRAPGSDGSGLESAGSGPLVALRAGCVACVATSESLCG